MPSMSWSVTLQISGSPALAVARAPVDVEAVDRIEAVIAPGDNNKVLDIQPGGLGAIHVLLIKSSSYGPHMSFKVSDGVADSNSVVLDSPQLFSGGGVALFNLAPRQLKLSNSSTDQSATVEILVARDATP